MSDCSAKPCKSFWEGARGNSFFLKRVSSHFILCFSGAFVANIFVGAAQRATTGGLPLRGFNIPFLTVPAESVLPFLGCK
jgi:hypothetical protein